MLVLVLVLVHVLMLVHWLRPARSPHPESRTQNTQEQAGWTRSSIRVGSRFLRQDPTTQQAILRSGWLTGILGVMRSRGRHLHRPRFL